jgi:hypothetical protein
MNDGEGKRIERHMAKLYILNLGRWMVMTRMRITRSRNHSDLVKFDE